SLMSRYRNYENTSIKMGTFYIPPLIKDTNVVSNFSNKLNLIIKGNSEIFKNAFPSRVDIVKGTAEKLTKIKSNSIDYIYTDPPYSDILNYSELNIVFEGWLKEKTNNKNEMIVSKYQNKDIKNYTKQFGKFLKEAHRVLKPNSVI